MSGYSHLTAEERDRLAGLMADGLSLRSIAKALGRAASSISRELRRNALDSGAYRPHVADGAYMLRRQRAAVLETDARLAAHVTDRLIPTCADHHPWAHWRIPMDMIFHGRSTRLFQASQQSATMSS